jgi:hypothetical protein
MVKPPDKIHVESDKAIVQQKNCKIDRNVFKYFSKKFVECKGTYQVPVTCNNLKFVKHFWLVDVYKCELIRFFREYIQRFVPRFYRTSSYAEEIESALSISTGNEYFFETSIKTLKTIAIVLINVVEVCSPYRCCC